MEDLEFEYVKSQYEQKNLRIGVELAKGRVFLLDVVKDTTCLIWGASFTIIMIISFFISIYCLGFLAIVFSRAWFFLSSPSM